MLQGRTHITPQAIEPLFGDWATKAGRDQSRCVGNNANQGSATFGIGCVVAWRRVFRAAHSIPIDSGPACIVLYPGNASISTMMFPTGHSVAFCLFVGFNFPMLAPGNSLLWRQFTTN